MDDGEGGLDLDEPVRVDRSLHQNQRGPKGLEERDRALAAMGRPVLNDPEDPMGAAVRLLSGHLGDQTIKPGDPTTLGFPARFAPWVMVYRSRFPGHSIRMLTRPTAR